MNAITFEVSDNRKVTVTLDDEQYDLVFNTRAAKMIADKYGSITEFGDELTKAEQAGRAIDMYVWVFMVLANQGISIHNRRDPENKKPFFTEEDIELLTTPADWQLCKEAIMRGSGRYVLSEDDGKNAAAVE